MRVGLELGELGEPVDGSEDGENVGVSDGALVVMNAGALNEVLPMETVTPDKAQPDFAQDDSK